MTCKEGLTCDQNIGSDEIYPPSIECVRQGNICLERIAYLAEILLGPCSLVSLSHSVTPLSLESDFSLTSPGGSSSSTVSLDLLFGPSLAPSRAWDVGGIKRKDEKRGIDKEGITKENEEWNNLSMNAHSLRLIHLLSPL